jgi:hypothetical protein
MDEWTIQDNLEEEPCLLSAASQKESRALFRCCTVSSATVPQCGPYLIGYRLCRCAKSYYCIPLASDVLHACIQSSALIDRIVRTSCTIGCLSPCLLEY